MSGTKVCAAYHNTHREAGTLRVLTEAPVSIVSPRVMPTMSSTELDDITAAPAPTYMQPGD